MTKTVDEIAKLIDGKVIGDGSLKIKGITNIENPKDDFLTFINDTKYLENLEGSKIAAIIAPENIESSKKTLITCANPKLGFARVLQLFFPREKGHETVSTKATISEKAKVGKNVTIDDFVVVEEGAEIGENSVLKTGVFIGKNAKIGSDCVFYPHVVIYENCVLGNRVIVHANTAIGSDGFGYVHSGIEQVKVPQVGNVIIEDDVEIGTCSTIDRATLGSTIIRKGVKIDNQVQIAHNVEIGENSALSSFVGISGSSKIGKNCILGGQVGLADHCELGNNVMVGAQSGIAPGKKVPDNQVLFGSPARPLDQVKKQFAASQRLPKLYDKIAQLEERIKELEN